MACYNCNYRQGDYSCVVCRGRYPGRQVDLGGSTRAGEELGEGIGSLIIWFLTNRVTSFVGFYAGCMLIATFVAPTIGLVESWMDFDQWPVWYKMTASYGPIPLMVVFRKKMPVASVESVRYGLILATVYLFWYVMTA